MAQDTSWTGLSGWRSRHGADFAAILLSGACAMIWPLQTLVLAFAFLGPFHYLTEVAWLRKRDFYFGEGLLSPRIFVVVTAVLCIFATVDFYLQRGWAAYLIALLAILSLSTVVRNWRVLLAVLVAAYLAKFFVHGYAFFFGALVPTVVHVYVFTFFFVVSGLIRERKKNFFAWVNPFLLAAMPFLLIVKNGHYAAPADVWIKGESGLFNLHQALVQMLGRNVHPDATMLSDSASVMVVRFLAFIYLYHYLNWFTKTELLNWHKVSRETWQTILVVYSGVIGCYLMSFRVGFYAINFLSLLHVLLEFPLNWRTMQFLAIGVGRKAGWMRPAITESTMRASG